MASSLISPTGKDWVLPPVRANAGVEAEYQRALKKLVKEMSDSLYYWISAAWRANEPAIAELAYDALPANELRAAMRRLGRQWLSRFDVTSGKLARWFAQKTKDYSDPALQKILKDGGFAVRFTMSEPMRDAYQAVIAENVGLIKSIAQQHLTQVETVVMQGVQHGRDIHYIQKELKKRYGISNRRAGTIATDQANKATAVFNRVRRLELGITEAQWLHSGGGAHPRHSHVVAGRERRRFDVAKGCLIDGEYIQPGQLINCRCTSRPVIPALE